MASFAEHKKILKFIETFTPKLTKIVEGAGVVAVNHFTKSFNNQGFTDEGFSPWKRRRNKDSKRGRQFKKVSVYDEDTYETHTFKRKLTEVRSVKNRAILVKSGRLRRSLRSRRISFNSIKIYTDVPYASVHNNGERSGRGKGFKMPKRQFIGYSGQLNRKIIAFIDKNIKKQFNK